MPTTVNLFVRNIDIRTGATKQGNIQYFIYVELQQKVEHSGKPVFVRTWFRAVLRHELPIGMVPRHIWDNIPDTDKVPCTSSPGWWNDNLSIQHLRSRQYEFGTYSVRLMEDSAAPTSRVLRLDTIFSSANPQKNHQFLVLGWNFIYRLGVIFDFFEPPPLVTLTIGSTPQVGCIEVP